MQPISKNISTTPNPVSAFSASGSAGVEIKICGMKYAENITDIGSLLPDYMGFIFWEKSARYFDGQITDLPESVKKVGVFVNESIEVILAKALHYNLHAIQLHGEESVEFCTNLKQDLKDKNLKQVQIKIIKVFSINDEFDFELLTPFELVCDFFLFDTKGKLPGGNGYTFDWKVLNNYPSKKPFFLSGGIGADEINSIKEILKTQLPIHALDLNSKFETAPGLKDKAVFENFQKKIEPLNFKKMSYNVNEKGYYGEFGGAFIPEMLYPNVEELRQNYLKITAEPEFQAEFDDLLKEYVGRPTPLYFAKRLSEQYNTKIYLKREDLCHTGAHKINNTIGQIILAKRLGKTRIIAETGAGQHGVATATVCALMGLECIVYMGEVDIKRQAPNVARMKMLGAEVRPAMSGSKTLKDATNEAIRDWINNPVDTYYIIGSVVGPHPYPDMVARFQSVISKEIKEQLLEKEGRENPDYVIACVGGGSNAAGTYYHFLDDEDVHIIAVEAAGLGVDSGESAATSALGKVGVIHGSKTLLMQSEDGQITEPYSISAGLDYPGVGPMHANLFKTGRAQFISITDERAMDWGIKLSQMEGLIPAIESAHAFAVLDEMKFKPEDIVVINLSGRGDKDLNTYIDYFKL
jgi:phosphoribosylanthranilate isomerase